MSQLTSAKGVVLLLGGTGATGSLLWRLLLDRGFRVRAIARFPQKIPQDLRTHRNVEVINGDVLSLSDSDLTATVSGCSAVASCLGHNMSFSGIFGSPRKLVTETVRRISLAIEASTPTQPVQFVLMNTAGNSNRDLDEKPSLGERCVIFLIRHLIPPHSDNEMAADFLRTRPNAGFPIQWVVVRPDTLINNPEVTAYKVFDSPNRSAIFDPGKTSRINVAHFMAELIGSNSMWKKWQGKMPVIYNSSSPV